MVKRPKYHGWIVVEERAGHMPRIYAEYVENDERKREFFQSETQAVEWWDKRMCEPVALEPTLTGHYRVYVPESWPLK